MKLYNYFLSKSIGQRIRLIIAFVALLTFCFFIIKGNIFDKKTDTPNQATSQTEIIEITTSEATVEVTQTQTTEPLSFHISIIDVGILVAVVTVYSIHKLRERKRERR